jgi:hypothetical protein
LVDDKRIYEDIKFTGLEKVTITVAYNEMTANPGEKIFTKVMRLRNKKLTRQANERGQVIVFDMVEDHGFYDNTFKISRSFSGTGPEMIRNILKTINKDLDDTTYIKEFPPVQPEFRYIPPFLNPLSAAYNVKDRLTSKNGSPFFLRGGLYSDTIDLISFDDVMKTPPRNIVFPYLFSESNVNWEATDNTSAIAKAEYIKHFVVGDYSEEDMADTFVNVKHGNLYNDFETFDIFNGKEFDDRLFIGDHLENLKKDQVLRGKEQTVYSTSEDWPQYGDIETFDNNANETYSIVSGKTFSDLNNLHDVATRPQANKKVQQLQLLRALESNAVKISTRGFGVLQYRLSAGDSLSMVYLRTKEIGIQQGEDETEYLDDRRSGHFLIMETKHIFRLTDHFVNMKISKLSSVTDNIKNITFGGTGEF